MHGCYEIFEGFRWEFFQQIKGGMERRFVSLVFAPRRVITMSIFAQRFPVVFAYELFDFAQGVGG